MTSKKGGGFRLAGISLKTKTSNQHQQSQADCGRLWQQFESEKYIQRIPHQTGSEVYAVYYAYEGDHTQPFSYFIGCRVAEDAVLPPDIESLWIPEDTYLNFVAKGVIPDCIAATWQSIWKQNYPRSYHMDYEVYGEKSKNWENGEVTICLSVK